MATENPAEMSRYRALMTDTDREYISGDPEDQGKRHQSVYRVRQRINDELPKEIEILREHRPDLLEELQEVVCEERADGDG